MALRTLERLTGLLQPARDRLATDTARLVCCPEVLYSAGPAHAVAKHPGSF